MNYLFPILAQAEAATPPQGSILGSPMVMLALMFAIFYFLLIRPQQRREKERKQQISELRAGVRILFCGGMIGVIKEVKDATFMVEVASGTVVEIARGAVERPLADGAAEPAKK